MEVDYSHISETYDSFRSFPGQLRALIVELGAIRKGDAVLDVGCGTGNAAAGLRRSPGACAFGVDRSPAMLTVAAAKGVPVVCADVDGRPLPFHDVSFHAVIAIYIIHQIRDLGGLFSECRRILANGALVLLTSGHSQIELQHPAVKRFFPSFVSVDKSRFPDIPEVDRLLVEAGFDDVDHDEIRIDGMPIDEVFLEKVRNKYISTYGLIPQDEFSSGVQQLEAYIRGLKAPEFRSWHATLVSASKRAG